MVYRVYVEKRPGLAVEAAALLFETLCAELSARLPEPPRALPARALPLPSFSPGSG